MNLRIIYWISTGLIVLFEGVLVALTSNTEMAVEGIKHLGYPNYFGPHLAIMKIIGSIVLILPYFKGRIKEWVYAGFFYDFLWATISHGFVDGWMHQETLSMLLAFGVWTASYTSYHQLNRHLNSVELDSNNAKSR